MHLATFLFGMVCSAGAAAVAGIAAGMSAGGIFGLVVLTMVMAQILYLGLILAMTRGGSQKRAEQAPPESGSSARARKLLALASTKPNH